jgi:hypothetical protein
MGGVQHHEAFLDERDAVQREGDAVRADHQHAPMAMGQVPAVGDGVSAMAHVDDGDGLYAFPESDPPYVMDGGAFVVPFALN